MALLLCLLADAPAVAQESRTYELEGVIFTVPAPPEGWKGGKQGHGLVRYQSADGRASVEIYRHEPIRVVGQAEESAPDDRAREALRTGARKARMAGRIDAPAASISGFRFDLPHGGTAAVLPLGSGSLVVTSSGSGPSLVESRRFWESTIAELRFEDHMPAPRRKLPWGTLLIVFALAASTGVAAHIGAALNWDMPSGNKTAAACGGAVMWTMGFVLLFLTPVATVVMALYLSQGNAPGGTIVFVIVMLALALLLRLLPLAIAASVGAALGVLIGSSRGQTPAARWAGFLAFLFALSYLLLGWFGTFKHPGNMLF